MVSNTTFLHPLSIQLLPLIWDEVLVETDASDAIGAPSSTPSIPATPTDVEHRLTQVLNDRWIVFGEGCDPQYNFLDNDYPCSFEFGGRQYLCATAAYEAQKLLNRPDLMEAFTTLNAKDALALSAEKHLDKYPVWYEKREESMYHVLRAKFGQDTKLLGLLLLTADAYLSSHTSFKGMDPFWTNNTDGTGSNRLGQMLMAIRKEFGGMGETQPPANVSALLDGLKTDKPNIAPLNKSDGEIRREIDTLNARMNEEDYQSNSSIARNPSTHHLTRFSFNNFPYDKTLVPLSSGRYINASFMLGKQFIGTQSPMPHTSEDFWSMVLEHNVAIVIMLNRLGDPGDNIYFPFAMEDYKQFGTIHLELAEEPSFKTESSWRQAPHEEEPHAVIHRKIIIQKDGEMPRQIHHYQYQNWRDMCAGNERAAAYLTKTVHAMRQEHPESPIVAHCHAGVGRTSVIVTLLDQLHAFSTAGEIDIMRSVEQQRSPTEGRCNSMMQSTDQYAFCYRVMRLLT